MSRAASILDMIRKNKQGLTDEQIAELKRKRDWEESFKKAPVTADDWQRFKRDFVEEYGGEKVQKTGMTHSEFLRYMKDSTREGVEEKGLITSQTLRDFLRKNCP